MNKNFYFISSDLCICDPSVCAESENTFDLSFNTFALNQDLITKLCFMDLHLRSNVNESESLSMFATYLSAFSKKDNHKELLLSNPNLRFLITSNDLKKKVSTYLSK